MANSSDEILDVDNVIYGIIFPVVLLFGFLGGILNLIILYTSTLKGPHYIYMRGMSICDLLALLLAIPFTIQMSQNQTVWKSEALAWYYAHLELYLSNTFVGAGVFLTVAITVERYVAFCHPYKARTLKLTAMRRSTVLICVLPVVAAILYVPFTFRSTVITESSACNDTKSGEEDDPAIVYEVVENYAVTDTVAYTVYNYGKEVIFRIAPAIMLTVMNVCIIVTYHRANIYLRHRRFMCEKVSHLEVAGLQEEKRLIFILSGLSIQFILCTAPAALLALTVDDEMDENYSFTIFRGIANLLEITKNASTFYVYCLCSVEYRRHVRQCASRHSNRIYSQDEKENNLA